MRGIKRWGAKEWKHECVARVCCTVLLSGPLHWSASHKCVIVSFSLTHAYGQCYGKICSHIHSCLGEWRRACICICVCVQHRCWSQEWLRWTLFEVCELCHRHLIEMYHSQVNPTTMLHFTLNCTQQGFMFLSVCGFSRSHFQPFMFSAVSTFHFLFMFSAHRFFSSRCSALHFLCLNQLLYPSSCQ